MSPIKGIASRGERFAQIGQIRKGGKKVSQKSGKEYPVDLEYLNIILDEEEVEAARILAEAYGPKPKEVDILLPFDDIGKTWDYWLEAYTASRLIARSDGERLLYLVDPKSGDVMVRNGNPETTVTEAQAAGDDPIATYLDNKGQEAPVYLKPSGRLKVILPILGRLVYLVVITGSWHDIANITAQLEAIKATNNGRLAGIPLLLRRRKKEITKRISGKSQRGPSWLLSIEPNPRWVQAKLLELDAGAAPALPAGDISYLPNVTVVEPREEPPPPDDNGDEPEEIVEGEATEIPQEPESPPPLDEAEPQPNGEPEPEESKEIPELGPGPEANNDYRGYYESGGVFLGRDDLREILVAHKNKALEAWETVSAQYVDWVGSQEPEQEPQS